MESIIHPLDSMKACMAFDSRDWSLNKNDAWIYGIVHGWPEDALSEVAEKHKWIPVEVARLRLLHSDFKKLILT